MTDAIITAQKIPSASNCKRGWVGGRKESIPTTHTHRLTWFALLICFLRPAKAIFVSTPLYFSVSREKFLFFFFWDVSLEFLQNNVTRERTSIDPVS